MNRATTKLPEVSVKLVKEKPEHDPSSEMPREIPWAGLFDDPGMAPAERLEEDLAEHWPDALDRGNG
jgi:hypothetical protein